MTPRERFYGLLNDFANANHECGSSKTESAEYCLSVWHHANECEIKLLEFIEPYLPKD